MDQYKTSYQLIWGASQYGTIHYAQYHTILCAALVITNHLQKILIDHGDKPAASWICNFSAYIAPFLILDERCHPYNCVLMMLCSDLHGKEKPLSSPSQEIMDSDFRHLQILTIWEEKQNHYWPFKLWSLTLSTSLDDGRKWGYCRSKKVGSLYFSIFHAELHDWPFSWHLSKISCKRATINFKSGKQLGKSNKQLQALWQWWEAMMTQQWTLIILPPFLMPWITKHNNQPI